MREIKFRAWIKDMVEMVQVNAIILEGATFEDPGEPHIIDEHNDIYPLTDVELMEYIGRPDMDDNEIYESDIVISSDFGCGPLIVRYDWERAAFVATSIVSCKCKQDRVLGYTLSRPKWSRVRKIGNIYENPKLLTGGEPNERD